MKKYLVLINFLCFSFAFAQFIRSGIILDKETKLPIAEAQIYNENLKFQTDEKGKFELFYFPKEKISEEKNILKIEKDGYLTAFIELDNNSFYEIYLEKNFPNQLEEVIVTSFSSTNKKKSTVNYSLTQKKELEKTSSSNLIDAIQVHPSISQITTGGSVSKPIIRGLGYNRVVVAKNGIRQEDQQWGDEHGILIDANEVEKIEILNSSSNLLFGADAMGGVINVITKKKLPINTIKGSIFSGYQTNSGLGELSLNQEGRLENLFWKSTFSGLTSGNYKTGNSKNKKQENVFNSTFRNLNFSGHLGYNYNWGSTEFFASLFSQKMGLNQGDRNKKGQFVDALKNPLSNEDLNSYKIFHPFQKLAHYMAHLKQKIVLPKDELYVDLAYQRNKRQEVESENHNHFHKEHHLENQGSTKKTHKPSNDKHEHGHPHSHHHDNKWLLQTFNYLVQYKFRELDKWKLSLSTSGMFQKNKNLASNISLPDYSLFDVGMVAHIQKKLGKFYLESGMRYDLRALKTEEFINEDRTIDSIDRNFNAMSASAGFSYLPFSNLNLKLNYSKGFRAPNLNELSSNGSHAAVNRHEEGNPNLKPETNHQLDGGLIYEHKHGFIELSSFYNYISNFIFIYNTGEKVSDKNKFRYDQKNAAYFYGGEILINLNPAFWKFLSFQNSLGLVKAKFANTKDPSQKNVPFIPASKFQSQLELKFDSNKKYLKDYFINLGYAYFFEKKDVFLAHDTETNTPGYGLINAGFGMSLRNKNKKEMLKIFILGNNLLNKAYISHLSRFKFNGEGKSPINNMGRNISLKVIIPLIL